MSDYLVRAVNRSLAVRIVAAVSTDLGREAAQRHHATPGVACALLRGLTSGVLLSTLSKAGERVTIQLACDGPLKGLTVDAYNDGDVRGYPQVPRAWEGRALTGRQRLRELCGYDGVVNVLRELPLGAQGRYQGQVPLTVGEVDEDVEAYLRDSEQVPSALGCEVVLGPPGADGAQEVQVAGGFLAQVMPSGNVDLIHELHHRLRSGELYQALAERGPDVTPEDIARLMLPGVEVELLDRRDLRFRCRCSLARIEAMLATLPLTDLDEMIAEGQAEITCNYCNQVYRLDAAALTRVREALHPRERN